MNYNAEIEAAILGSDIIAKADYLRWIGEGDLDTRARVYCLTESAWVRIRPEPGMAEHCGFMLDYLLECMLENPTPDDFLHSGFEAAHEFSVWLKHLSTHSAAQGVILEAVSRLGAAYKEADATGRNRIETGALEHLLESPKLRVMFISWATDPLLREAYGLAFEWGLAHSEDAK
jgi:hypothetical protein